MDHHCLFPAICSVAFQVTLFTPAETPKVGSCGNEHGNFIQFAGRIMVQGATVEHTLTGSETVGLEADNEGSWEFLCNKPKHTTLSRLLRY